MKFTRLGDIVDYLLFGFIKQALLNRAASNATSSVRGGARPKNKRARRDVYRHRDENTLNFGPGCLYLLVKKYNSEITHCAYVAAANAT